jgi:hypothetical protein
LTIGAESPTIIYNSIHENAQNIYLADYSNDVDASYNWWGTTDTSTINQSIHDPKTTCKQEPLISFRPDGAKPASHV